MKRIIILGSTGSIGISTLAVARKHPDKIKIIGLSTKKNIKLLEQQIEEFKPSFVCVYDEIKAEELKKISGNKVKIYSGMDGLIKLAGLDANLVVSALVGSVGLKPTLEAICSGKNVALANKEVLVMAGSIIKSEAKKRNVSIIPIDSEHSALLQCLWKRRADEIKKLIITASGGPFYNKKYSDLGKITPKSALMHPTWKMGEKVTIDSATLMNKGFEVIEAMHLFDISIEKIDVVIHPESIIHAMVEFIDGSIAAFMHMPDMRVPIQYAISWPDRWDGDYAVFDLAKIGALHFYKADKNKLPALALAYNAANAGGTVPAVLSAADEIFVNKFLKGEIAFTEIVPLVKSIIDQHKIIKDPDLDDILKADKWSRNIALTNLTAVTEV